MQERRCLSGNIYTLKKGQPAALSTLPLSSVAIWKAGVRKEQCLTDLCWKGRQCPPHSFAGRRWVQEVQGITTRCIFKKLNRRNEAYHVDKQLLLEARGREGTSDEDWSHHKQWPFFLGPPYWNLQQIHPSNVIWGEACTVRVETIERSGSRCVNAKRNYLGCNG